MDYAALKELVNNYELQGAKILFFVVPVDPSQLEACALTAATIEDRVQQVMIAELNECLAVVAKDPYNDQF